MRVCIGQEIFARLKETPCCFRPFFLSLPALNFYSARNCLSNGANSGYLSFAFFLFRRKLSDSAKFPAMKFNLPALCRGTRILFYFIFLFSH